MKKWIVIVLLLLPVSVWAWGGLLLGGSNGVPIAGGEYDDITFFWRCEGFTLTGDDYSAGDTVADTVGDVAINTDAVKIGTNGLDIPGMNARVEFFNSAASDIISGSEGRIGFWLQINTLENNATVLYIQEDSDDYLKVVVYNDTELLFSWKEAGVATTLVVSPTVGVYNFYEYAWDSVSNTRTLYVNGVQEAQNTDSFVAHDFSSQTLTFGITLGYPGDKYMDNIMISSDADRDFCGLVGTCVGVADDTVSPK